MQEKSVKHGLMSGSAESGQVGISVEFAVATEVLRLKGQVLDSFLQFINAEYPWIGSLAVLDFLSKSRYEPLSFGNVRRDGCKRSFYRCESILQCFTKGHSLSVEHL